MEVREDDCVDLRGDVQRRSPAAGVDHHGAVAAVDHVDVAVVRVGQVRAGDSLDGSGRTGRPLAHSSSRCRRRFTAAILDAAVGYVLSSDNLINPSGREGCLPHGNPEAKA
jgi:hypothetical protein